MKYFFGTVIIGTSNFLGDGAEPEKKRTAPQQYKFDTAGGERNCSANTYFLKNGLNEFRCIITGLSHASVITMKEALIRFVFL